MNLEEILEALGSLENAEDVRESIISAVNAEKEKGISSTRKKDKDVLKLKATLKELGYDKDEFDDLDSFVENNKKSKETSVKSELTINSLKDDMDDLRNELRKEREAKAEIEIRAKTKTLEAELTSAIGDQFYGSKYLIKDMITSGVVDLDEDGKVYFKNGEEVLSFEKGIESLKETNKDILKVTQVSGGGDSGGEKDNTKLFDKPSSEILDELF